jgi:hypothetical protein
MEVSGQLRALAAFTPGEIAPGTTHWIGGLMGSRASLDAVEVGKMLCPYLEYNPDRPARKPSLSQLSCSGFIYNTITSNDCGVYATLYSSLMCAAA